MISVLVDGAHWIWDAAMVEFDKRDEVLDVYHALEKISDCGKVLYGAETEEFNVWQDKTMLELLWNGFELIEKRLDKLDAELQLDLERPAESRSQSQTKLKADLEAIRVLRGYLSNHSTRLGYRKRLAEGKSIGSGQVEGACKNLIGKRLKQTGAKWRVRRVNNMGTLCSLLYRYQWKTYWISAK